MIGQIFSLHESMVIYGNLFPRINTEIIISKEINN